MAERELNAGDLTAGDQGETGGSPDLRGDGLAGAESTGTVETGETGGRQSDGKHPDDHLSQEQQVIQRILLNELGVTGMYMLHLAQAALEGGTAQGKPEPISWNHLYALTRDQSLESICWMGICTNPQLRGSVPQQIAQAWSKSADYTLMKQLSFDVERESISRSFAAHGISYMPVKGVYTAGYYPQPGMRSMGDNDILVGRVERDDNGAYRPQGDSDKARAAVDDEVKASVKKIMAARGYEIVEDLEGDTGFFKKPFYEFEMHRMLQMHKSEQYDYYRNPWRGTKPDVDDPHLMRQSLEDQYLFHIVHMHMHYREGGCGVRFVIDEKVLLDRLAANDADFAYIQRELDKLGLAAFEPRVKHLAQVMFGTADMTEDCARLLMYMLSSGTYGSEEHHRALEMQRLAGKDADMPDSISSLGTEGGPDAGEPGAGGAADSGKPGLRLRLKYIWRRIYPERAILVAAYPILGRHPWLYPFTPFYRIVRGLRHNPGKLFSEWRFLRRK